jgi:hypothetical protein
VPERRDPDVVLRGDPRAGIALGILVHGAEFEDFEALPSPSDAARLDRRRAGVSRVIASAMRAKKGAQRTSTVNETTMSKILLKKSLTGLASCFKTPEMLMLIPMARPRNHNPFYSVKTHSH